MSNERKLSFESIDEQIEKYVQMQNMRDRASQAERWWFAIGLFAIGVCMPIGTYVGGIAGVRVLQAGIAVECLGLGLSLMLMVRREWKTFVESRRTFAKELDQDFRKYREYVSWLRKFPRKDIQQRLRFIEARRNTMMYRMGCLPAALNAWASFLFWWCCMCSSRTGSSGTGMRWEKSM